MGRATKQSNPTEINGNWAPSGDDVAGAVYTQHTYDWRGRPLETRDLTDGSVKYAEYSGCGCAGGEMVTLTDEVGRQQKIYSDVLGRQWKTEVLNWNGTVYSTTTNTFNARDQITLACQYQATEGSGVYKKTIKLGSGLRSCDHTTWDYNADDTIQKVTDARGASATYAYNNNRHLVTNITYNAPSGIPTIPAVSFGYDAAGNRTSMSDGTGTMAYHYDQLSRMDWEDRTFTGVSGTYRLSYAYNLANELTSLSIPFTSQQIGYNYDTAGRLSGVTANGFSSTYYNWPGPAQTETLTSFASGITYRAWGARKSMNYGNTVSDSVSYKYVWKQKPGNKNLGSGLRSCDFPPNTP